MKEQEKNFQPTEAQMPEITAPTLTPCERYVQNLDRFQRFYLQLLIFAVAIAAAILAVALIRSVWIGLLFSLLLVFLYQYFLSTELKSKLGLSVKSIPGGLSASLISSAHDEEMWIPGSLLYTDVTELSDSQNKKEENQTLHILHLPASVSHICRGAFEGFSALNTIAFEGNRETWEGIVTDADISGMTILYDVAYPPMPKKSKAKTSPDPCSGEETSSLDGEEQDGGK